MLGEPEDSHPELGSVVDVIAASRGDTLMSWVDDVQDGELIVSVPTDRSQRPVTLQVGEHLEVVWKASRELQALPVVLAAIDVAEQPRWRLRPAGVVKRGQRRDAVRAPLTVSVRLGAEPTSFSGATVDLSEGGLRCILEDKRRPPGAGVPSDERRGDSPPPRTGDVTRVVAMLPDLTITCLAEVTRQHPRDDSRLELSLRFIGLTETEEDLIRRRVFARLRELRHRGLL